VVDTPAAAVIRVAVIQEAAATEVIVKEISLKAGTLRKLHTVM
jgi:hypothetical protein